MGWREEETDPLVDVHCYVRVDGRGRFSDDPDVTEGLFLFTDGDPNDRTNPIGAAGSRLELRFVTVYRSGAFDPDQFLRQSWKRAPSIEWFIVTYEGDGRILSERITTR